MQILTKAMVDCVVEGTDGDVGVVKDVFFSSDSWRVRYLVIDTGRWLHGRQVVLAPYSIDRTDWPDRTVIVSLTREQIEASPSVQEHEPVSRQHESELAMHFRWPIYWGESEQVETGSDGSASEPTTERLIEGQLQSAQEVIGYRVEATDGEIGYVDDLILDDETWTIRYLVVKSKAWIAARRTLVSPGWAKAVSWKDKTIQTDLTNEKVTNSPEFNPREPVNREYEVQLYDYYARPSWWN